MTIDGYFGVEGEAREEYLGSLGPEALLQLGTDLYNAQDVTLLDCALRAFASPAIIFNPAGSGATGSFVRRKYFTTAPRGSIALPATKSVGAQ